MICCTESRPISESDEKNRKMMKMMMMIRAVVGRCNCFIGSHLGQSAVESQRAANAQDALQNGAPIVIEFE